MALGRGAGESKMVLYMQRDEEGITAYSAAYDRIGTGLLT